MSYSRSCHSSLFMHVSLLQFVYFMSRRSPVRNMGCSKIPMFFFEEIIRAAVHRQLIFFEKAEILLWTRFI